MAGISNTAAVIRNKATETYNNATILEVIVTGISNIAAIIRKIAAELPILRASASSENESLSTPTVFPSENVLPPFHAASLVGDR